MSTPAANHSPAYQKLSAAEVIEWLKASSTKPVPVSPQPEAHTRHRHPLATVDFWAISGTLACLLLIGSTLDRINVELVHYISVLLCLVALVSNLTRDRTQLMVYKFIIQDHRPRQPKPPTFGSKRHVSLRQLQEEAGVAALANGLKPTMEPSRTIDLRNVEF